MRRLLLVVVTIGLSKSGNEDLQLFHRVVTAYITAGNAASRRAQAGGLAELLAPNRNV
jgi:hypothetical protein